MATCVAVAMDSGPDTSTFTDGVLSLHIPRRKPEKPKATKIQIGTG